MLGLESRPLTFVNSLGLGDPPSTDTIHRRISRYPDVHFKLDAAAAWTLAICEDLAATRAVDVVDFKGQYGMEVEDPQALAAMYEHVIATFPDAILEDPHDLPEVQAALAPHADRVSYDALITQADDLDTTPINPIRVVNIKPCRTGSLRRLLALYARGEADGLLMYGGGMGELGVARGQIQLLASLFHPDGPNDVAPSPFNGARPAGGPADEPAAPGTGGNGLPPGELAPDGHDARVDPLLARVERPGDDRVPAGAQIADQDDPAGGGEGDGLRRNLEDVVLGQPHRALR